MQASPDGPHDRDPGGVKMSDRMQEEGADDATQDNSTLDEERPVGDWVPATSISIEMSLGE